MAFVAMPSVLHFAHLWEVEALDPSPQGDLSGVEEHWVLVHAGDGAVLQQLAACHLGVDDLCGRR